MDAPWRILVVDDEPRIAQNNATALNRAANSPAMPYSVQAVAEESFEAALVLVGLGGIDLLVLDVFDQVGAGAGTGVNDPEPVGRSIFEQIRAQRFLPIIFLTALPDQVESHENPPFVQILPKGETEPFEPLFAAVKRCLDSPFPSLCRGLQSHIDGISRQFMIDFVEQHWEDLKDRSEDVAHLLMRRLGVSFDAGQDVLIDDSTEELLLDESVPPIRYYVVPAPSEHRMGDIITQPTGANTGENNTTRWQVVMTPSCDLVKGRTKAEYVVLAECVPLASFSEYQDWVAAETSSNSLRRKVERLLKSNPDGGSKNRLFYLPAAWKVPHLMVDLQRITYLPYSDLSRGSSWRGGHAPCGSGTRTAGKPQQRRPTLTTSAPGVDHLQHTDLRQVQPNCHNIASHRGPPGSLISQSPFQHSDLSQYVKQASLDDPYAAELSHQFYCYLGRVGTPDLDLDTVIDGMRSHSRA